ncbi:MAG: RNA polymerase sigma factor, partial [Anaerolineae bacterium]
VFRIAHNKAVSWLRSRKEPESLDVVARGQTPQRTFSGTQPSLDGLDDREALARALAYLSPKHRAVIELAFGQQMTYKEIALVMECPEGTVKSRMKHALQSLERILQRDGYER